VDHLPISLALGVMAYVVAMLAGYPYLRFLRRRGLGKKIRIEGPSSHSEKMGTPTMGGVLIWGTVLAVTLLTTLTFYRENGRSILFPVFVLAASGTLGLIDDRMSLLGPRGGHAAAAAEMAEIVAKKLKAGDAVMVKGSFGSRMRDVVARLATEHA
jgi:phospho-N-acetylmuramoyl-pentapeptide-transferase